VSGCVCAVLVLCCRGQSQCIRACLTLRKTVVSRDSIPPRTQATGRDDAIEAVISHPATRNTVALVKVRAYVRERRIKVGLNDQSSRRVWSAGCFLPDDSIRMFNPVEGAMVTNWHLVLTERLCRLSEPHVFLTPPSEGKGQLGLSGFQEPAKPTPNPTPSKLAYPATRSPHLQPQPHTQPYPQPQPRPEYTNTHNSAHLQHQPPLNTLQPNNVVFQ
jgi:hypothetical protein